MASIVIASGVSFEFSNGRELFRELSFSLDSNRVSALVGPNGIGKTCLARLLVGEIEPTAGMIRRNGSISFHAQSQAPGSGTVDEFLGIEYEWSMIGERLLDGIDRQALCSSLSGGQWMRVRLARVLDDQFLILDEPTNDLDRDGREAVMSFLRDRGGGALLISHDRECLQLCEDVLELSNRGLSLFRGGWSSYEESKELEREGLRSALESAVRDRDSARADRAEQIAKQEKRNRQGAKSAARGGQAKILLGGRKGRAQSTTGKKSVAAIERANDAVQKAHEAFKSLKVDPVMYVDGIGTEIPAQKLVAEARGFNIRFKDWIFGQDLDFSWRGNARVALKGPNGSGKSTLLKAVLGHEFETRGELRRGDLITLSVDQRCASLDDEKSVLENIRGVSSLSESEIRNGLAQFLFAKEAVFQKVKELSGGERLRAALARGFLASEHPELLVLDEPTNHLDLANIEFLEGFVREFRGALLVVSHDEVFLENCEVSEEWRIENCRIQGA